ncbi:hypothetical protein HCC61_02480 [Streptomyces sp. HNM0575]|uniref:hypothetical protein n=1 Tax=Streptomyces sp. HNM0575 TaxID=2716338 RepID=UPI00145F90BE|nr:hypothetical protein [Streptomyces sp. HNM0575]NLU71565.1 hypothetical protein [Streptomyces sp. HNM0575]
MTARARRIDRVPAEPVSRAQDGAVSVPLRLLHDGVHHSDLDLRLPPAEAETLHAQLSRVLVGDTAPRPAGTC